MNIDRRKFQLWPLIMAAVFFFIPVALFFTYPIGLWSSGSDNEPLGLANALNMAYRLADFRMYPANSMSNHPGVQFYLMSWLALAFSGHPVATAGQTTFFRDVIDHVEDYHRALLFIAALVGAAGVYVFARTALKLIPVWAIAVGLLLWLVSTPATILYFMSPGFESVAILVNSLFLLILVQLAFDRKLDPMVVVLAGCIGAFAYLNKLSYVYVPLALVSAIFWKAVFCRTGWFGGAALIALFIFTLLAAIAATGFFVIGWNSFLDLLTFHRGVILGSGLYGAGDQVVVDQQHVRNAIMAIPGDRAYAIPLALAAGATLFIAGVVTGLKNPQRDGVAVVGIGTGLAAFVAAIVVLKHYESHYVAGVSAALPACVVATCLFTRAWNSKARLSAVAVVGVAVLCMAGSVFPKVAVVLARQSAYTRSALTDMKEISAQTAGMKQVVDFAYRVPFSQYGEGFVVYYSGVPRLTQQHIKNRRGVTNSITENSVTEDVGAYVIDKTYFHDAEAVKNASNLDLLGPKPVQFAAGDKLIELNTVFLLIRK